MRGYPDVNNASSVINNWILKSQTMYLNWSEPSVKLISDFGTDPSVFPPAYTPIFLDFEPMTWIYFLIESTFVPENETIHQYPIPHPMHIHGHDFYILQQSNTNWCNGSDFQPNLTNPPRRDTATCPQNGYLMIAFQMDNPGAVRLATCFHLPSLSAWLVVFFNHSTLT